MFSTHWQASEVTSFDPGCIDATIAMLARLRRCDGRIDRCNLLFDGLPGSPTGELSKQNVSKTIANIQQVKKIRTLASSLLTAIDDSAQEYISKTTKDVLSFGFTSLPHEMLARIFELACPQVDIAIYHLAIAGTCRLFRTVVNNHARLWCDVTNWRSKKFVDLQLERSKGCGLVARMRGCFNYIKYERGPCHCADFVQSIVQHCNRWKRFSYERTHGGDVSQHIRTLMQNLHLPALERLIVSRSSSDDDAQVCKTWIMPNLNALTCDDTFVDTSHPECCRLQHLRLIVHSPSSTIRTCFQFLQPCATSSNLQSLRLDFGDSKPFTSTGPALQHIELNHLRNLSLQVGKFEGASNLLAQLLNSIHTPNIQALLFILNITGVADGVYAEWMKWMCRQKFVHLTNVGLSFKGIKFVKEEQVVPNTIARLNSYYEGLKEDEEGGGIGIPDIQFHTYFLPSFFNIGLFN